MSSAVERGGEDTYVKKVECFSSIITMFEPTTMYAHCFPKIHPCIVGARASLHAWNIYAFFFANLGVEASRLTGRRENGGAVGGIFGHS